jgi:hypothetical protein
MAMNPPAFSSASAKVNDGVRLWLAEWPLLFCFITTALFLYFSTGWLSDLSNLWWTGFLFL